MMIETPLIKPNCLKPSQTVAIISPAAPTPSALMQAGCDWLIAQALVPKVMPNALANEGGYLAGSKAQRLADLVQAFEDPSVDAILCAKGGFGSTHLLPELPFEVIKANPKLFMGFSDITALHLPIVERTGLVTFYSPMLVPNLLPNNQLFTQQQWWQTVGEAGTKVSNQPLANNDPYHCLRAGTAQGRLLGGNLSLITALCGTPWQPNTTGCLLFLEDWKESFRSLDRQLTQLWQAGVIGTHIAGLIFGDFSKIERPEDGTDLSLAALLNKLTQSLNCPVGYGFTLGHGDQTATWPIGVQAMFDAEVGHLTLLEAPVVL